MAVALGCTLAGVQILLLIFTIALSADWANSEGTSCTYTFTVENADAKCISQHKELNDDSAAHNKLLGYERQHRRSKQRRGEPQHSPDRMMSDQNPLSERDVLTKLLLTVNKLLQHQNVLENVKLAHKSISDLKDEMHDQHAEAHKMVERILELESQLQLLTSGKTLQDDGRRSEVFKDFTGATSRYLGCPEKSGRRIHEMAPIKMRYEELIRAVPRSCTEWARAGFTQKGIYMVDPDGMEDEAAFIVECRMNGEQSVAVVHHDHEQREHVTGHDAPGSYNRDIKYPGVTWEQLKALTSSSYRCEQLLRWECKGASITRESWWVDVHGEPMLFWGGGRQRGCACLLNDTCAGGNLCNCDMNKDTEWLEDSGLIWQKEHLPVRRLQFGDTGGKAEEGYFTLGPLVCYSNKTNPYGASNAFMPVEIYKPFNVFCDLDGWIVISRHTAVKQGSPPDPNRVTFHRVWAEYRDGFGKMDGDFWLGLERVHHMTTQGKDFILQIVFTNRESLRYYAQYSHFHVSNEADGFRLYIGHFTGTSIDALSPAYGQLFSTRDRDNDLWSSGNCAEHAMKPPPGGWWYTDCGKVFLHGNKLTWGGIDDFTMVEMKIKPSS